MHARRIIGGSWGGWRRRVLLLLILSTATVAALAAVLILRGPQVAAGLNYHPERDPQTSWVRCNRNAHSKAPSTFTPLSDAAAAALVTPEPETRPDNAKSYTLGGVAYPPTTTYVPTNSQLQRFRSAKTSLGQPVLQFNPYLRYVDGRDGLKDPSTDDLIQWAAHKWGIPENWLRAEYVLESYWSSYQLGDVEPQSRSDYERYPLQARVPGQREAYESLGITQVRWGPSGWVGAGTEPLRWESMAFNIDYQAAMVRFFYDNPSESRTSWGDSTYGPCEKWNSIGGWFASYPWLNPGQASYIKKVQGNLENSAWRSADFLTWTPSSLPPGIKLR
jgi:hypothetical protein